MCNGGVLTLSPLPEAGGTHHNAFLFSNFFDFFCAGFLSLAH